MRRFIRSLFLLHCFLLLTACGKKMIQERASTEQLRTIVGKFSPIELSCDLLKLPANDAQVLKLLVKASRIVDTLFLNQVSNQNLKYLEELKKTPSDSLEMSFFNIMFGPWDRLDADKPCLSRKPKPAGANFYPEDMTKVEFESWVKTHPEDKEAFESSFTVIRRREGKLEAIPYAQFYSNRLLPMAKLLNKAAETTQDPTLKDYLKSRAEALLSNDYFDSDMKWMDLAGNIEAVIGPYEVYEDRLFEYKAAFESFICVVDHEASATFMEIVKHLDAMEKALPLAPEYQLFSRGKASPIKVVNLVYSAGDARKGVQTAAFNLPNDERVREAKGSKKVMLKNVMKAKFEKCWIPIAQIAISERDMKRISFDTYFNDVLMHEVSHGLGPGKIVVDGAETTVNKALKDQYSTIEECKADVLGVLNMQFLIDRGVLPKSFENTLYATTLGGMFRSIRFGIDESHGGGVAIQLNHYLDQGAFRVEPDGRFSVDDAKMKPAVRTLAAALLLIEAKGDYEGAKAFIQKYRTLRPSVSAVLEKLNAVPVDIRPIYPIEKETASD